MHDLKKNDLVRHEDGRTGRVELIFRDESFTVEWSDGTRIPYHRSYFGTTVVLHADRHQEVYEALLGYARKAEVDVIKTIVEGKNVVVDDSYARAIQILAEDHPEILEQTPEVGDEVVFKTDPKGEPGQVKAIHGGMAAILINDELDVVGLDRLQVAR